MKAIPLVTSGKSPLLHGLSWTCADHLYGSFQL